MIFSPEGYSSKNHACTLSTIINIESFIYENSGLYSKTELWKALPKKIMYQSYKIVLEYLLNSNKITIRGKKVIWNGRDSKFNLDNFSAQNHNATLNTICSIESFLVENSGLYSKTELWNSLPKKIMYQTYKVILAYLDHSDKLKIEDKKVKLMLGGQSQ
ncbi:MAG: hypothetical protein PF569_06795 [Candidatus Woesearchaeota archaeon]|jgi:hypothetical protein|nr:hypothetical protein [Candidatus Woesearchaeota archaeon]